MSAKHKPACWLIWLAAGIILTSTALALLSRTFEVLLYERDLVLQSTIIQNASPLIAVSLWLFAGLVFLIKGLKKMIAVRHTSWFAIASIASFSVFVVTTLIAIDNYLDYQHAIGVNKECMPPNGDGWCGVYGIYPYNLVQQNIIIFSVSSTVLAAIGILFLVLRWKSDNRTALAVKNGG